MHLWNHMDRAAYYYYVGKFNSGLNGGRRVPGVLLYRHQDYTLHRLYRSARLTPSIANISCGTFFGSNGRLKTDFTRVFTRCSISTWIGLHNYNDRMGSIASYFVFDASKGPGASSGSHAARTPPQALAQNQSTLQIPMFHIEGSSSI
jgi:hypothetical protein